MKGEKKTEIAQSYKRVGPVRYGLRRAGEDNKRGKVFKTHRRGGLRKTDFGSKRTVKCEIPMGVRKRTTDTLGPENSMTRSEEQWMVRGGEKGKLRKP